VTHSRRKFAASAVALAGAALLAASFAAPASASVASPGFIQPAAGATQINLVGFNDFHGRIVSDNGVAGAETFAATVIKAQQGFTEANSLVISNGDAVGASPFDSSILKDQPTIDVLNTIGVDSFTQGNHEFDQGMADAAGRLQQATSGADLAANITKDSDGSHPFDQYKVFTVAGIRVGVIGAVTQETPSLVSPAGIAGYTFGDPVAAVNRVADQLTDGDPSNGEADVLVASYHEGAPLSNAPLGDNLAASQVFTHIVNDTSAKVSAIYNAHTHQTYAYDAPVGATTRPVVQAGSYSNFIGQIVLTVDPATKQVTAAASSVVPTYKPTDIPADVAADPRLAQIRSIVEKAKIDADALGKQQAGKQQGDITRAKVTDATGAVTGQDNRADESSLGGVIADSMLGAVRGRGQAADAAVMNPGGLRADLIDDDGVLTYREIYSVLPFTNNLAIVSITGADLKNVLEEQWQLDKDGNVPSRAYLQLGLSDNFTYAYDPGKPRYERIVAASIDGVPLVADQVYRIAVPTFLASGGDNFHSLAKNVGIVDTGLIDYTATAAWVGGQDVVVPDTARNGFRVTGLASGAELRAGEEIAFTVGKVDLASLGAIKNTSVSVYLGDDRSLALQQHAAIDPVTGDAHIRFTLPAGAPDGLAGLTLVADQSDASVSVPVTITGSQATTTPEPSTGGPETPGTGSGNGNPGGPGSGSGTGQGGTGSGSGGQGQGGSGEAGGRPSRAGDGLATSGADQNAVFGIIAASLAAIALGGTVLVLRRRGTPEQ